MEIPAKLKKKKKRKEKHQPLKFHTDVLWKALRSGCSSLFELHRLCGMERLKTRGMYFITSMNK